MFILTENNVPFPVDQISEEHEDIRYCVFDYTDKDTADYYFIPMLAIETYNGPVADIMIGGFNIQLPWDWSLVIGEKHVGDLEVVKIEECMEKDFSAFAMNPIDGFMHDYLPIEIKNGYQDIRWYTPLLKNTHVLAIPLTKKDCPLCVFAVKDGSKVNDTIDVNLVLP